MTKIIKNNNECNKKQIARDNETYNDMYIIYNNNVYILIQTLLIYDNDTNKNINRALK